MKKPNLALSAAVIVFSACNSSSPTEPSNPAGEPTAQVSFAYTATTTVDGSIDYDSCSPNGSHPRGGSA